MSVCGASYTYGDTDIFSLGTRSGMQVIWIGTSICLGFVLLMMDDRLYDTFAYVIYGLLVLLLFATIFNPHSIKGSRSWIVLGPLRLQPAEFAKFATALAISKFMSSYGFTIHNWKHFATACGIILLPMICIVGQSETGLGFGLSLVLPHVLPRGNARLNSLYRDSHDCLFCSWCKVWKG